MRDVRGALGGPCHVCGHVVTRRPGSLRRACGAGAALGKLAGVWPQQEPPRAGLRRTPAAWRCAPALPRHPNELDCIIFDVSSAYSHSTAPQNVTHKSGRAIHAVAARAETIEGAQVCASPAARVSLRAGGKSGRWLVGRVGSNLKPKRSWVHGTNGCESVSGRSAERSGRARRAE